MEKSFVKILSICNRRRRRLEKKNPVRRVIWFYFKYRLVSGGEKNLKRFNNPGDCFFFFGSLSNRHS